MSGELFRERLRASALSMWELGDLLGIHPHHLHGYGHQVGDLREQPFRVIIELARRHLDVHPADLSPTLSRSPCPARPEEADDKLISFRCVIMVDTPARRVVSR